MMRIGALDRVVPTLMCNRRSTKSFSRRPAVCGASQLLGDAAQRWDVAVGAQRLLSTPSIGGDFLQIHEMTSIISRYSPHAPFGRWAHDQANARVERLRRGECAERHTGEGCGRSAHGRVVASRSSRKRFFEDWIGVIRPAGL